MARKSKLLAALDAHKGRDFMLEKQKKLQKQAEKRKRLKTVEKSPDADNSVESGVGGVDLNGAAAESGDENSGFESEESGGATPITLDASRIDDSDSDSDGDPGSEQAEQERPNSSGAILPYPGFPATSQQEDEADRDEDEDEDQEGIPLSDIESLASEDKGDIVPHQRLTINNTTALLAAHKSIAPSSPLPFSAHQTLTTTYPVIISDVNDDLTRELAFYKQCLDSVNEARSLLKKEAVPFSRPSDYFAEMVKSDEHMGKIKQKMTEEAVNKKAAAEARKQRDLKKFGKQVQVAKQQERDRQKRDMLGKIDLLKRKRKNTDIGTPNEDLFDVALEDASKSDKAHSNARNTVRDGSRGRGPLSKRQKKNEKFGFGGKKRFAKSGDAISSGDLGSFSTKKMKGQKKAPQRLGKSRRAKL